MSSHSGYDACAAKLDYLIELLTLRSQQRGIAVPSAPPSAPLSAPTPAPAPPIAPSALLPTALPAPPPAPKLPPQPIPTPVPARSYPPAPSVEALDEVELKQVYKQPLRNIRKQPIRQKHRAAEAMPKCDAENFDAEFFDFENCIAWPPKFGGTNMRLSRDQYLDAWYTTMLNTHAKELVTRALPFPA